MKLKNLLGTLATAGMICFGGCNHQIEGPYKPLNDTEVQKSINQNVIVEGLPGLIQDDQFILNTENSQFIVTQSYFNESAYGDYTLFKLALGKEVKDGDEEKIKVYGVLNKDNLILGRYADIEGTLYPFYY